MSVLPSRYTVALIPGMQCTQELFVEIAARLRGRLAAGVRVELRQSCRRRCCAQSLTCSTRARRICHSGRALARRHRCHGGHTRCPGADSGNGDDVCQPPRTAFGPTNRLAGSDIQGLERRTRRLYRRTTPAVVRAGRREPYSPGDTPDDGRDRRDPLSQPTPDPTAAHRRTTRISYLHRARACVRSRTRSTGLRRDGVRDRRSNSLAGNR